tara:strand:+ start:1915 stop:2178 length:264 start_codon:yes stop_codon:yes gene_type:complete
MQIIDHLDIYMKDNFPDYYIVKKTDKERRYIKRYYELEQIYYGEVMNGERLEMTVPIGEISYYKRFNLKNQNIYDITNFLDSKTKKV